MPNVVVLKPIDAHAQTTGAHVDASNEELALLFEKEERDVTVLSEPLAMILAEHGNLALAQTELVQVARERAEQLVESAVLGLFMYLHERGRSGHTCHIESPIFEIGVDEADEHILGLCQRTRTVADAEWKRFGSGKEAEERVDLFLDLFFQSRSQSCGQCGLEPTWIFDPHLTLRVRHLGEMANYLGCEFIVITHGTFLL